MKNTILTSLQFIAIILFILNYMGIVLGMYDSHCYYDSYFRKYNIGYRAACFIFERNLEE